jgi:biotin carboxyl carrier protein
VDADHVITPLGDGRFLATTSDGRQQLTWAVADGTDTWVFVDGRSYRVTSARAPGVTAGAAERGGDEAEAAALSAPMPARVLAVQVGPGQSVARGDLLIMLEAMKMELPIEAPRDGKVKAIRCAAGDLVQPGLPLLDLE